MVSNRSIIQTFFEERKADGTVIFMATSTGNEALVTKYVKEVGKDVVSTCLISYLECKPIESADGKKVCYMTMILNIDVAGSLPDFVKKAIGEAQAKGLDQVVEYIIKNYK